MKVIELTDELKQTIINEHVDGSSIRELQVKYPVPRGQIKNIISALMLRHYSEVTSTNDLLALVAPVEEKEPDITDISGVEEPVSEEAVVDAPVDPTTLPLEGFMFTQSSPEVSVPVAEELNKYPDMEPEIIIKEFEDEKSKQVEVKPIQNEPISKKTRLKKA